MTLVASVPMRALGFRPDQGAIERRIMIVTVAATVVCAAALMITNASAGTGSAREQSPSATTADEGAPRPKPVIAAQPVVATLGAVGDAAVLDGFDRAAVDGGELEWTTITGGWTVADEGGARVITAEPGSDEPAWSVFTPPPAVGERWQMFAGVASPADNMGLTWGVVDPRNYWEVRLVPSNAVIVVNQVIDGDTRRVALYGPVGVRPGDALRIERDGDAFIVAVGDHVLGSWTHPGLTDLRRAGIFAAQDGGAFGTVLVAGVG